MQSWQYNPYAAMATGPEKPPVKPDVTAMLAGEYWLDKADLEKFHFSEMLGKLISEGFVTEYSLSDGWGGLPPEYLAKLRTYCTARLVAQQMFEYEYKAGKNAPPVQSPEQVAKAKQKAKGMLRALAG